jgi:hypothetical protein
MRCIREEFRCAKRGVMTLRAASFETCSFSEWKKDGCVEEKQYHRSRRNHIAALVPVPRDIRWCLFHFVFETGNAESLLPVLLVLR